MRTFPVFPSILWLLALIMVAQAITIPVPDTQSSPLARRDDAESETLDFDYPDGSVYHPFDVEHTSPSIIIPRPVADE